MNQTESLAVLVIGGTGFIGYHAVAEMHRRGHRVTAFGLDLPTPDLLPEGVPFIQGNFMDQSDTELREILGGFDALVFAAGVDDRTMPKAPAYPFFRQHNVESVSRIFTLAREAGVTRGVVCGSYFAYFNRAYPQWRLAEKHPYIRSRCEQATAAFAAGGETLSVSVLELPYIFGRMPGRRPLWCPLVSYLRSPWPLFYTTGGTNMISVHRVAEAIAGAVVKGQHGKCYPIGGENRTWPELLVPFSRMVGRPKRVLTIPSFIVTMIMALVWLYHVVTRVESGLHPTAFVQLQTALTYFDPTPAQQALGFSGDGLKEALQETIDGCD